MHISNDAQTARALADTPVGRRIVERARQTCDFWITNFADDSARISGWAHNFVCPDCAAQLAFDYDYQPGREYACPHCGKKVSGPLLDEAWVYYYRYHAADALMEFALLYKLGNERAGRYMTDFISFYADRYAAFERHGIYAGQGKVMGQSLCEAVWALKLIKALMASEMVPDRAQKAGWYQNLFRPLAALVQEQAKMIHNIPLWLQCAAGAIAVYFADDELLDSALNSEFGIRNQVAQGYTKDGIWYECSMGYHYYATDAFLEFMRAYAPLAPGDPLIQWIERVYVAPVALSFDQWQMPAINDGWYPLTVQGTFTKLLDAHRITGSAALARQLNAILGRVPDIAESSAALLYGPVPGEPPAEDQPSTEPVVYADTCLAIMKRPFHVLLKAGVLSRSHMHPDCMGIEIPPFSFDLGTPGYAHPLTKSWYRATASHNTFLVDGLRQPRPTRGCVRPTERGVCATAEDVYDGVNCRRTLTEEGEELRDVLEVHCDRERETGLLFHCEGTPELPGAGAPTALPADFDAREHFTDVCEYPSHGFFARFTLEDGRRLTLRYAESTLSHARVFVMRSPGNPADQSRTTILLRASGAEAVFDTRYAMDLNRA